MEGNPMANSTTDSEALRYASISAEALRAADVGDSDKLAGLQQEKRKIEEALNMEPLAIIAHARDLAVKEK
jgi:hypothetical protein